jgi:prepilin-type N-terminal cleavage/methylation domain-containing protein
MFQTLSKKLKNRKGFTLIELIVVLAILGIILAIAVPNYLGVQDSAAESADVASLELAEKAMTLWSATTVGDQSGTYKLAFDGTTLTGPGTATTTFNVVDFFGGIPQPSSAHYTTATQVTVIISDTDVSVDYWTATAEVARP